MYPLGKWPNTCVVFIEYIYMGVYIYICMCMCGLCVCVFVFNMLEMQPLEQQCGVSCNEWNVVSILKQLDESCVSV